MEQWVRVVADDRDVRACRRIDQPREQVVAREDIAARLDATACVEFGVELLDAADLFAGGVFLDDGHEPDRGFSRRQGLSVSGSEVEIEFVPVTIDVLLTPAHSGDGE